MRLKKLIFIFLLTAITFISCEKVIEPKDLPQQDARIVLNAVLDADAPIYVELSSSKSIVSGKDYKFINNATCSVYEDGSFVEQLLFDTLGTYIGNTIPKPDKTYTIKVSAPGFQDVEGTSRMRSKPGIGIAERYDTLNNKIFIYTSAPNKYLGGAEKFKYFIQDDPSQQNFYLLKGFITVLDSSGKIIYDLPVFLEQNQEDNFGSVYYGTNGLAVTDEKLVNGNLVQNDFTIQVYSSFNSVLVPDSFYIYLFVSNLSPEYYQYIKTLSQQQSTGANLFAEPVLVANNIKNGMGIVGCLNTRKVVIRAGKLNR